MNAIEKSFAAVSLVLAGLVGLMMSVCGGGFLFMFITFGAPSGANILFDWVFWMALLALIIGSLLAYYVFKYFRHQNHCRTMTSE
jgi:phosphotransferase system  glucose/maltose/N-acetylglucosamine-specific IIC component